MERLDPNEFMRLEKGSNRFRVITNPYIYSAHRIREQIRKCCIDCIYCAQWGELESILVEDPKTKKQQKRWIIGVLDRGVDSMLSSRPAIERLKILDFPVQIFAQVQVLNRDEDWGDPKNYDLDIVVDPDAGEFGIYVVMPRPKRKLADGDLLQKAFEDTLALMQDFCNPVLGLAHEGDWHPTASDVVYGVSCGSCSQYYSYAESRPGFECWACRNGW